MTTATTSADTPRPAAPPTRAAAPRRATPAQRLWSVVIAAGCLAMLLIGAQLSPSSAGHGTHTQLGLPRCGWEMALGFPCATCGMTTAISHASRGRIGPALASQPFGALLAVFAACAFWIGLHTAATGSRLGPLAFDSILQPRALWWILGAAAAAWAYKALVWTG